MTRFREEVYAAPWYKAKVAGRTRRPESAITADERARRKVYFEKPPSVREAIRKAQKAQLRMF